MKSPLLSTLSCLFVHDDSGQFLDAGYRLFIHLIFIEGEGFRRTACHAEPAADTFLPIDFGEFIDHLNGMNLTAFHTNLTARTPIGVQHRREP